MISTSIGRIFPGAERGYLEHFLRKFPQHAKAPEALQYFKALLERMYSSGGAPDELPEAEKATLSELESKIKQPKKGS
jgi:hypothetical protein